MRKLTRTIDDLNKSETEIERERCLEIIDQEIMLEEMYGHEMDTRLVNILIEIYKLIDCDE